MDTAKRNSDNSTKYPKPWTWLKSLTDSTLNQGEIPPPINSATAVTVPNKLTYGKKYSSSKSYYFLSNIIHLVIMMDQVAEIGFWV